MKNILASADVVLIVGDITNFGRNSEAAVIVAPVIEYSEKVLAVSGNCDFKEVDDYLNQQGINLHGRGELIDGIGFVGLGGSLVTPFKTPNEYTEAQLNQKLTESLSSFSEAVPLVLVSHQPPYHTACDRISSGVHVGSQSVRGFIEKYQPLVCFTGHIHESSAVDKIGETYVINPGMTGKGSYAYAEIKNGAVSAEIRRVI